MKKSQVEKKEKLEKKYKDAGIKTEWRIIRKNGSYKKASIKTKTLFWFLFLTWSKNERTAK